MTVVTHGVDIPPKVAPVWNVLVEARLAITASAARCPDKAAIGTPGPGCTLPPARYRPCRGVVEPGLLKMLVQPCVACPYSAPPLAGKRR